MKLTGVEVRRIFTDCQFKPDEITPGEVPEGAVEAEGIVARFGFHPERLASHKDEITELVMQLPDEFRMSKGGGWSFLNMCQDREGYQWADLHQTMEMLLVLGIAVGKMMIQIPKELWPMMPGGVPYVAVIDIEAAASIPELTPKKKGS